MINVMELIKGQRLICLSIRMRISEIEQILKTTRHSGYPIIGKGQFPNFLAGTDHGFRPRISDSRKCVMILGYFNLEKPKNN